MCEWCFYKKVVSDFLCGCSKSNLLACKELKKDNGLEYICIAIALFSCTAAIFNWGEPERAKLAG